MTFEINTGYYLDHLTPNNEITWKYFEITEVVLVHCNIVNNYYQQNSYTHLFQINHLVAY